MIYNKNQTVVEFGKNNKADIQLAIGLIGNYVDFIFRQLKNKVKIGKTPGKNINESSPVVIFRFYNEKSIDVVIDSLNYLKEKFIQFNTIKFSETIDDTQIEITKK